jgi:predicted permease
MSGALVVVQVGLSLVLVVAAGLFGRTFAALASRNLGFDPDPVLVIALGARGETAESTDRYASFERAREAAASVPGVACAALSVMMPAGGGSWQFGVEVVGEPQLSERERGVYVNAVSPGWFDTYGTSIVSGRDIGLTDSAGAPPVALVNRAFVRKFLGGSDPIGRLVRQVPAREPKPPVTIVGVVDDAIYRSLRAEVPPTLYLAHAQQEGLMRSRAALSVRSAGPPVSTLIAPMTRAIQVTAPDLALTFRPLSGQISALLIQERLLAAVSGFFGGLGLLLAMLGLYGVTAHNVSRRRAEIGIRMALGGSPGSVVRLMLRRVAMLVGTGIALGGIASYWAARFLTTLVFGIEARDPSTFAAAAVVLLGTALAAALLPARHASRIDPVAVLRDV